LLVVGHLQSGHADPAGHANHADHGAQHDHQPPAAARVTAHSITERLDPVTWDVVTAGEHTRTLDDAGGGHGTLQDVVVRAVRRGTVEH
jgi:hypothetical protein